MESKEEKCEEVQYSVNSPYICNTAANGFGFF